MSDGDALYSGHVTIERIEGSKVEWDVFDDGLLCGRMKWNGFGWMFMPIKNFWFDSNTIKELSVIMKTARGVL